MTANTYSPVSDPIANPSAIYFALLGGVRTPGILHIDGNSGSPRKWDERGGYGLSGSTLVFTGKGLAPFDIVIELYTSKDWQDFNQFRRVIDLPQGRVRPKALDITHPFLNDYAVKKCVVLDIAWPKVRDDGVSEILIPCKAFRSPKFVLSKPAGAQSKPADPREQRNAAAAKELQDLNDKLSKR